MARPVKKTLSEIEAEYTFDDADEIDEPTSWRPVDLTDALNGAPRPEPTVLRRTDGKALLYRGRTHSFQGESETLKSWGWQLAAAQELISGNDVFVADFEDDERSVVGRLLALDVPPSAISSHLVYVRPNEPLYNHDKVTRGYLDFMAGLRSAAFTLGVVDGVTEAMLTEGLDLMSNADVAAWNRRLLRVIADTGAAAVAVDHVSGKGKESPGRYAIGGQHKLAGISGAAYTFTGSQPLGRATTDPIKGSVVLTVAKDRPGGVRGWTTESKAGVLEITSYPDMEAMDAALRVPGAVEPDLRLVKALLEHLSTYDGATKNALEHDVEGRATSVRDALRWMLEQGYIVVQKVGAAHRHHLTDRGREQLT